MPMSKRMRIEYASQYKDASRHLLRSARQFEKDEDDAYDKGEGG
jgi:hypothetical protein